MSLFGIRDVVVNLVNFRNIDLFQQGLYCLQLRLFCYDKTSGSVTSCVPYAVSGPPAPQLCHGVTSGRVDGDAIRSRSFVVRYCDEEVEMGDMAQFRLEEPLILTVFNDYANISPEPSVEVVLHVDLLFSDLSSEYGTVEKFLRQNSPTVPSVSKIVATRRIRLGKESLTGNSEYLLVSFDDAHACTVDVLLMTTLLNLDAKIPSSPTTTRHVTISGWNHGSIGLVNFIPMRAQSIADEIGNIDPHTVEVLISNESIRLLSTALEKQKSTKSRIASASKRSHEGGSSFLPWVSPVPTASPVSHIDTIRALATQLYVTWNKILLAVSASLGETHGVLRVRWSRREIEKAGRTIFREIFSPQIAFEKVDDLGTSHKNFAENLRKNYENTPHESDAFSSIIPDDPTEDDSFVPIVFQQEYNVHNEPSCGSGGGTGRSYIGVHLIVLCHGFQGSSIDMRLLKNTFSSIFPEALFLNSTCNENGTEGSIDDMGSALAEEVLKFVADTCPESALSKLSFVGHSLGGLIIRAALPKLQGVLGDKFYTYMSLSSPHLGLPATGFGGSAGGSGSGGSKFVEGGLWLLRRLRNSVCLEQLLMEDSSGGGGESFEEKFLFKLSKYSGLDKFKHVLLLSSPQDTYAPFDSARIESSPLSLSPLNITSQMVENISAKIRPETIIRLDVVFRLPEKNLDTLIGRAAHIQFLENTLLMRIICHAYGSLFS